MSVKLSTADLLVDQVYQGSRNGNASDDPLPALLGVDSGAGFRHLGKRPEVATLKMLVLKTNLNDPNWPDSIDRENGLFTYYGDRHSPGELHDTPRQGNAILRNLFDAAHNFSCTAHFPPIFIFASTGEYRDVKFLGLAVPGADGLNTDEDLVAVWRTAASKNRFQNYKAVFTILDVPTIPRAWITDLQNGRTTTSIHAPKVWLDWVRGRKSPPLRSIPASQVRSKEQQIPAETDLVSFVEVLYRTFEKSPTDFEKCAMGLARLFLPSIHQWELTRPWRDGGRDAVGTYRIGSGAGHVDVEFALEAKCYSMKNGVGVRGLSRLVSRLRHRQFGVLVTTSYLAKQAYEELVDDKHPVVLICAADIAAKAKEIFGSTEAFAAWISRI